MRPLFASLRVALPAIGGAELLGAVSYGLSRPRAPAALSPSAVSAIDAATSAPSPASDVGTDAPNADDAAPDAADLDASPDPAAPCSARLTRGSLDTAIATAVLPGFDPVGKTIPLATAGEPDEHRVVSARARACRGEIAEWPVQAPDTDAPLRSGSIAVTTLPMPEGGPRIDGADATLLAWVVVIVHGGLCDVPQGFLALVERRGDVVRAAAIASWQGSCGSTVGAAEVLRVAGQPAIAIEQGGSGEDGSGDGWRDLYLRRGEKLVRIGEVSTRVEEWRSIAEANVVTGVTSKLAPHPRGLLKHETKVRANPADGGVYSTHTRTLFVELRGDKLLAPVPLR